MERFGIEVERDGWQRFTMPAGARYQSPGSDPRSKAMRRRRRISSRLARWAAARCACEGVGRASIQGDVRFRRCARCRWARTSTMGDDWIEVRGVGTARQARSHRHGLQPIPDAAMTIAVAALFADGTTHAAQHRQLAREGNRPDRRDGDRAAQGRRDGARRARITSSSRRRQKLTPNAAIDTYDDHRMAMCFSLVSLRRRAGARSTTRNASARPSRIISSASPRSRNRDAT